MAFFITDIAQPVVIRAPTATPVAKVQQPTANNKTPFASRVPRSFGAAVAVNNPPAATRPRQQAPKEVPVQIRRYLQDVRAL